MTRRGKGITWDLPDATPLEDIQDFVDEFLDFSDTTYRDWLKHLAGCVARGENYLTALKTWPGGPVMGDAAAKVMRGYAPEHVIYDEALVDWDIMDTTVGGGWLEFCTEPVERL